MLQSYALKSLINILIADFLKEIFFKAIIYKLGFISLPNIGNKSRSLYGRPSARSQGAPHRWCGGSVLIWVDVVVLGMC